LYFRNTANDSECVWQLCTQSIQSLPTPEEAVLPPQQPTKTSKVVRGLLIDDRPVSVRKTAECLNISNYTVCTIVEQYFGKMCITIVPVTVTMEQKQERIASCHDFLPWQRMGGKNRYRWGVVELRVLSWNKATGYGVDGEKYDTIDETCLLFNEFQLLIFAQIVYYTIQ
jgi:hypothetical protein